MTSKEREAYVNERLEQLTEVQASDFLKKVQAFKEAKDADGNRLYTEREIAKLFGLTTIELRLKINACHRKGIEHIRTPAKELREEGKSFEEIAKKLNVSESIARYLCEKT